MIVLLIAVLSGCSPSPACDSSDSVDAAVAAATDVILEDVNAIASMGSGDLSEDEKRMFKASMQVSLQNIRQRSGSKEEGSFECAADLVVISAGSEESIPVTYRTRLAGDQISVSLSGVK